MERGKLSEYSFQERPGASGPYHKLQYWRDGKNQTRYVSAEELPAVEAALAGHAQYRRLTEHYADLVVQETRQNIAGSKKTLPAGNSHRPGRRNPTTDRLFSSAGFTRQLRRPIGGPGPHGGFLARKHDGNPGWQTIWRGWRRLIIMAEALDLINDR